MKKLQDFCRRMFSRKLVIVCTIGVALFVLVAVFAGVLSSYDPNATSLYDINLGPSAEHLLGTDNLGRDVLTRLMYGARVSLIVGVLAVTVACVIGVLLGLCAAYFGGMVDMVIMRLCEALMSIPSIILSMALIAVFGSGMRNLAIILGVSTIPGYVRMMRAQALTVKESDYVLAGQLQGAKDFYMMLRHILPNAISPIIVMMTQMVGTTILMESGLSFIGIGVTVPMASWGSMVANGKNYLLTNPTMAIAPGVFIALLVICLNVMGDGVRDALDPRLRGEL